jgi:hypothetical protein
MKTFLLVATAALSFTATQAIAQESAPEEAAVPVAGPKPAAVAPIAELVTQNAILRAGTPITLRLMEVTTKKKMARVGQRVRMEVAAPVYVNDVVVIPAGSPAEAELTSVRNKGMWGKSGKLEARALFARVNGRQIRLTGAFDDKGVTGTAGVVGAIALVPIAGFFMTGTSAVFPMGGEVPAFIDEDVELAIQAKKAAPMTIETPAAPLAVEAEASAAVAE